MDRPPPLLPQIKIPINISTFAQQGTVLWHDDQIDGYDHNLNMCGDLKTSHLRTIDIQQCQVGSKVPWYKESSLPNEGGPSGHPSAAPAEKFCSSIRFPNMQFQDFDSKAEAEENERKSSILSR